MELAKNGVTQLELMEPHLSVTPYQRSSFLKITSLCLCVPFAPLRGERKPLRRNVNLPRRNDAVLTA